MPCVQVLFVFGMFKKKEPAFKTKLFLANKTLKFKNNSSLLVGN